MMKKPAILIPSPHVTDNHQYKNAKVLSDADAAILIEEKDLDAQSICDTVKRIMDDESLRTRMSENIAQFARMDAGQMIYREITELIGRKK